MKTSKTFALLLIFSIVVTFFGCERTEKQIEVRSPKGGAVLGGALTVAVANVDNQLNPTSMSSLSSAAVGIHFHEGLLRLDPNTSQLVPAVAESWSIVDGGAAYVFNLRKGAKFHASEFFGNRSREITAKDVVYSYSRLARIANDQLFLSTLGGKVLGANGFRVGEDARFEGLVVIDDYTLEIKLTEPNSSFLHLLTQPAFGIVPKGSADSDGDPCVGAGPFMFSSIKEELVLVKNQDYHLKDEFGNRYPYLDTLSFVGLKSNSERLQEFFDGKIDIISGLELDPVRAILEQHVAEFSGKNPRLTMKRETENASYETYTIYRSELRNLGTGFMGYSDYSRVQIEQ